jgi:hypothetical protein
VTAVVEHERGVLDLRFEARSDAEAYREIRHARSVALVERDEPRAQRSDA